MPTITDDELARVQYLLHQAVEAARGLEVVPEAREQSDVIEVALTEARKILYLAEALSAAAHNGGMEPHP